MESYQQLSTESDRSHLEYVVVAPGGHYFMTTDEKPFLGIGHNDAISWPQLLHLRHKGDRVITENYIKMLAEHGVTILRVMLEYCADDDWLFEDPVGHPLADAVCYWDDLIHLCERHSVRLLVTFWDTFFMLHRWEHHPYSQPGSGFDGPASFCTSPSAREAQKQRIRFFIERWGGSGAIFAYDLLNEINPAWGGSAEQQYNWITEMALFVRECELTRWGKRHLITVSVFGGMGADEYTNVIFRHPAIDFVSTHVYAYGVIDNPQNTIDCALAMCNAVLFAVRQMDTVRPYLDSEHGPIHLFMDLHGQLPEAFDDEYFHNMSWAHLATGGAGGGLRWPFRHPHCLTSGMHAIQRGMAQLVGALDWVHFAPQPIQHLLRVTARPAQDKGIALLPVLPFGCMDHRQALIWLLRDLRVVEAGTQLLPAELLIPDLHPGAYTATFWNTYTGQALGASTFTVAKGEWPWLPLPAIGRDLAITLRA